MKVIPVTELFLNGSQNNSLHGVLQYTGKRGNNGLEFFISNSSSAAKVNQLLLLTSSLNYKLTIVLAAVFQIPVHRNALT
jgi:hypothetical protein